MLVQWILIWRNSPRCSPFPKYHDLGKTYPGHGPRTDGPHNNAEYKTVAQPHNLVISFYTRQWYLRFLVRSLEIT